MAFRIAGLDPEPFLALTGLSDAALAERGVIAARLRARASRAG